MSNDHIAFLLRRLREDIATQCCGTLLDKTDAVAQLDHILKLLETTHE